MLSLFKLALVTLDKFLFGFSREKRKPIFDLIMKPRKLLILGTGWCDSEVLASQGFVQELCLKFSDLKIMVGSGTGHSNEIFFGTWKGVPVLISKGRIHLNQDPMGVRTLMSFLLLCIGGGKHVISTSSVGGLGEYGKIDSVFLPAFFDVEGEYCPHLVSDNGEYVNAEALYWLDHEESGTYRSERVSAFHEACRSAKMDSVSGTARVFIPGPRFRGSLARRRLANVPGIEHPLLIDLFDPVSGEWSRIKVKKSKGFNAISMSGQTEGDIISAWRQQPVLTIDDLGLGFEMIPDEVVNYFITVLEDRADISAVQLDYCTDDHDCPDPVEIAERARKRAPQFGKILTHMLQSEWS